MMIDWNAVAGWAGGITTVLGSIGVAIWLAIDRAMKISKALPAPPTKVDIITTDSVAFDRLGATIEANTATLNQTNMMLTEIVTVGKDFTAMMREEREEREFEEEVEKRIKERLKAERKPRSPLPRRRGTSPKVVE